MNENMYSEREIDLKDMLYRMLKCWRKILLGAVIIALLAGLYQLYRGLHTLKDEEAMDAAQEKYEISVRDFEATGSRLKASIENLREQSAHQQEYNEKSVLMKINPMEEWKGNLHIYIDSKYQIDPNLTYQNIDLTSRLVSAYDSYLRSGEFYQEVLAQTPGIDELRFLMEVFEIKTDPETATIMINCKGATESDVQQMLDVVKTKIAEWSKTVQNTIGDHSYNILIESTYSTIDLDLDTTQRDNRMLITDYANQIGEISTELTEWEKQSAPKPDYGMWQTAKKAIKYAVIGGVVGLVVMCVWLAAKYALSDAIKTDNDWRLYRVPVLGRIVRDAEKKKFLPGLDSLIDRIFGRKRTATMEQSCELTAQNLSAVLKERGASGACIVGHMPEGLEETLIQKLSTSGTDESFRYAGDVLTDPAVARKLDNSQEVLLLSEQYVTSCTDVERTLTLLKACGKTVLGAVVVE